MHLEKFILRNVPFSSASAFDDNRDVEQQLRRGRIENRRIIMLGPNGNGIIRLCETSAGRQRSICPVNTVGTVGYSDTCWSYTEQRNFRRWLLQRNGKITFLLLQINLYRSASGLTMIYWEQRSHVSPPWSEALFISPSCCWVSFYLNLGRPLFTRFLL